MRRLAVCCFALCASLLSACQGGRFMRITVPDVPAAATVLYVLVNADGRDLVPEEFALADGHGASESFTLGLRELPTAEASAIVTLGVGVRDAAGCELGWGTFKLVPALFTEPLIDLDVPVGQEAAGVCDFERAPGMLRVEGGSYPIGCNSARDPKCFSDETPQRRVTLTRFQIDATEVVLGEYDACVRAGACNAPLDDTRGGPLAARNYVDHFRALAFCAWRGKRLPTEAEWEAAARGSDARIYPWGDEPPTCMLANFAGDDGSGRRCNGGDSTRNVPGNWPAGRSVWGAFDMAGNLEEWVADWYEARASLPANAYLTGPVDGTQRVVKGGSYIDDAENVRSSVRYGFFPEGNLVATSDPSVDTIDVGFRCAAK